MRRPSVDVVRAARGAAPVTPSLARWVSACALAEAVGIGAAAGAARWTQALADRPGALGTAWFALVVVVAGGLVEGTALGVVQARLLGEWLPRLRRRRYLLVTVLVAGVGWAAVSAPATLAPTDGGAPPPLSLVLLGAAGLGLAMGAVLGAAQAAVLRGAVPHAWRWVAANAVAWPPAMVLIFLGATSVGADWWLGWVLLLAVGTGAAAGAALGLVTGWHLDTLDGPAPHDLAVLDLLASRWRGRLGNRPLGGRLLGLEVHGRRTGLTYRLPVRYAADHDGLVVVPGRPERKTWWMNLRQPGTHVEVLWGGAWHPGRAFLLSPGDLGYESARATYEDRWAGPPLPPEQVVVRIRDATRGNH